MTATEEATGEHATTPAWSGINHLALITNDMDATVRFYHGVLGAPIAATVGTPEFRHYFFEFGPQCTVAFFEYANLSIEPFTKPAGVPDPRATQLDHVSATRRSRAARSPATGRRKSCQDRFDRWLRDGYSACTPPRDRRVRVGGQELLRDAASADLIKLS